MRKSYSVFCFLPFLFLCAIEAKSQASPPIKLAALSGRIVDRSGSPHVGFLQVFQRAIRDGHAELYSRCKISVGAEGSFECKNLPSGPVIVEVWTRNEKIVEPVSSKTASLKAATPRYLAVNAFYPGVTDIEAADEVTLSPGGQGWAEIRLPETQGATVTGIIQGVPAKADFRLQVKADNFELDSGIPVRYDVKSGMFTAQAVPDGHYVMTASWTAGDVQHEAEAAFVVKGANVDRLILKDEPFVQVQGTITSAGVSAVSRMVLYRRDNSRQKVVSIVSNGVFAFPPVPPGEYYLGLPIHQDEYIGAVQANGKQYADQKFPVTGGQATEKITVEVKHLGAVIRGALKDWNAPDLTAQIVAESLDNGKISTVPSDKEGKFFLTGLCPGGYRLYAWIGHDNVEYRSRRALKAYEGDTVTVTASVDGEAYVADLRAVEAKLQTAR